MEHLICSTRHVHQDPIRIWSVGFFLEDRKSQNLQKPKEQKPKTNLTHFLSTRSSIWASHHYCMLCCICLWSLYLHQMKQQYVCLVSGIRVVVNNWLKTSFKTNFTKIDSYSGCSLSCWYQVWCVHNKLHGRQNFVIFILSCILKGSYKAWVIHWLF